MKKKNYQISSLANVGPPSSFQEAMMMIETGKMMMLAGADGIKLKSEYKNLISTTLSTILAKTHLDPSGSRASMKVDKGKSNLLEGDKNRSNANKRNADVEDRHGLKRGKRIYTDYNDEYYSGTWKERNHYVAGNDIERSSCDRYGRSRSHDERSSRDKDRRYDEREERVKRDGEVKRQKRHYADD